MRKSWFPIKIRYEDTGEEKVINSPEEISFGRDFKIIKLNALEEKKNEHN